MTIASKHTIKNNAVKKFLIWIQKKGFKQWVFVFVVPSAVIGNWKENQALVGSTKDEKLITKGKVDIQQAVVALDM